MKGIGGMAVKIALVVVLALFSNSVMADASKQKLPDNFIFAYSGGGKLANLSAFLSEMITKYTPMRSSVEKTSGPTQSIEMVARGELHSTAYSAPTTRPYSVERKMPLRILFCGAGVSTSTTIGIFTRPGSGINAVKDLKGKRVYAEKPSIVWMEPLMETMLAVNGMTRKDIRWLTFSSDGSAVRDLKEGRVDAVFYVAGQTTTEMGESTGLHVVPLTPAEQEVVVDLNLGFEAFIWPAGYYGNNKDTPVLAAPAPFYTGENLDEFVAYTVVKTVYENLEEFQSSQKAAEGFTRESATAVWAFPYHPGAIRYYKEVGIWTDAHQAKQEKALAEWKQIVNR